MPRIKCASVECKYNNDSCHCTYKGELILCDCYVVTLNEGRQHYHRCKMYEMSERAKQLTDDFVKFMEERGLE